MTGFNRNGNPVEQRDGSFSCGSWRIRNGLLSHRSAAGLVDCFALLPPSGRIDIEQTTAGIWARLPRGEFSRGDVRDCEKLVGAFLTHLIRWESRNRATFPLRSAKRFKVEGGGHGEGDS